MTVETENDRLALEFISSRGTDCVGKIDNEDKLAAAMIYLDLKKRGLLSSVPSDDGPVFSITQAGKEELEKAKVLMLTGTGSGGKEVVATIARAPAMPTFEGTRRQRRAFAARYKQAAKRRRS